MFTAVITTNDLPNLAREINDAHRQVGMHAKGMLLEAKRAGEALLVAKQQCAHGEFKAWVNSRTAVSYRTAAKYMQVARLSKDADLGTFEGIDAFLDAHAEPKRRSAVLPPFTRPDAEYAMKLHRMAEGTANENEAAVAKAKLEQHAANHGITVEQVVEKSRKELGLDEGLRDPSESLGTVEKGLHRFVEPYRKLSKDRLVDILLFAIIRHPELVTELKEFN